jgi:hypothetical protein
MSTKTYKRRPGDGKGIPRTMSGAILDIGGLSADYGWSPRAIRGRVARRQIPFRKLGGRVVFIRAEIEKFFENLPGCKLDDVNKH